MASRRSLGERMRAARARQFVGRTRERAAFAAMLSGASSAAVLWVHGPGGVGKTTLLAQLRDDAEAAGRSVASLDAREIEAKPAAMFAALASALGCATEAIPDALMATPHVIVIDTYERFDTLDPWLRTELVPSLPDGTLLVLGGRELPASWRLDPSMQGLVEVAALRNLGPDESSDVLLRRGVAAERHAALVAATHGHPLALALVADLPPELQTEDFRLDAAPDVVRSLLDCLVRSTPTPEHRRALYLSATVISTTEELLRAVLGRDQAPLLYDWLRGLSFVQLGAFGLFPHDLARDVLTADLRARDRDLERELHRAARTFHLAGFDASAGSLGPAAERSTLELLYLHRTSPIMAQTIDFRLIGGTTSEVLAAAELPAALALIENRTNRAIAGIAEAWYGVSPQGFHVYRALDGDLAAVMIDLELDPAQVASARFDPAARQIAAYLTARNVRDGDRISIGRMLVHHRPGLHMQAVGTHSAVRNAAQWMRTGLAWSFVVMHDSARWDVVLRYMDHARLPGSEHEIDGVRYAIYAHDWRAVPRQAWLELIAERELSMITDPRELEQRTTPALAALAEDEFREAARGAIKQLHDAAQLARSPLARSRITRDLDGERGPALRSVIEAAARTLQAHPRDEKLWRAFHATYLDPAETQELAAERLDLPFSTYRRHLTTAVDRIVELLWERELS